MPASLHSEWPLLVILLAHDDARANMMLLSPQPELHYVQSQANKVLGRDEQIENKPHSMEKFCQEQSWKPNSFACCNNATQDYQQHINICTDTYQGNNQLSGPSK